MLSYSFSWKGIRGKISFFLQKCSWSGFPLSPSAASHYENPAKDIPWLSVFISFNITHNLTPRYWARLLTDAWSGRMKSMTPALKGRRLDGVIEPFKIWFSQYCTWISLSSSVSTWLKHIRRQPHQWVLITHGGLGTTAALAQMCLW